MDIKESLHKYLFPMNDTKMYNKWVRPVSESNEKLTVFFKLNVKQLVNVDEKNQLMHMNVRLKKVS